MSKRSSEPSGMRMRAMKWVDHWIGLPLCFVLGAMASVARAILPRRKRVVSDTGMLVVMKFFGLGSILEAAPLLRAIRRRYPQGRVAFLTFASNETLLRRLGVCTDLRLVRTGSPVQFACDVLGNLIWLRRHRTEAVVDLEFFSKFSTLVSFLTGARVRVGYHLNDFWRYSLLTHPIYFNYYRRLGDVYEQAGRQLDVQIADHRLDRIEPPPDARRHVVEALRESGWAPGRRLLGVNVNASDLSRERRWPIDRFGAVITELLERHSDLHVVLTGSPAEQPYTISLLAYVPEPLRERLFVGAGLWSLDEFLAALLLFDGFITNDSGPLHLAAAQGTPMVSLWGPTRPGFFAPRVDSNRILYADYHCSPCVNMFTTFEGMWCNHQAWCMDQIETAQVTEAVEAMLADASHTRNVPEELSDVETS